MPYYPSDQDWSWVARPLRVPIDERFPQRFAVNSLPTTGQHSKQLNGELHHQIGQSNPGQRPRAASNQAKGKQKANPNRIPVPVPRAHYREEGEIASMSGLEPFLGPEDIELDKETTDKTNPHYTSSC